MNEYAINDAGRLISGNPYPGRGLIIGKSADGGRAACAYFIMGRSANSRNRAFVLKNGELFTEPFDSSKVEDPSLIIYPALRRFKNNIVVSNGDQTDSICEGLKKGKSFSEALASRKFEPDSPHFTPRISGIIVFSENDFVYSMSVLKSVDADGSGCCRFTFDYPALPGLGHFIHTYASDGSPLPSFRGEPARTLIPADIDEFTGALWNALDTDNRISLYVEYVDVKTGEIERRLVNKNERGKAYERTRA